jgi:5-methylcytosine-specific restriction enzyme A
MRNPRWHRDEIILALDLYFDEQRGTIDASNPKVIEISNIINKLPLFTVRPDAERFRNPNGVSLKLSNFLAIDPLHPGKGMTRHSNLDEAVFKEFENDKGRLKMIAKEIKKIAYDPDLLSQVNMVEEDEQTMKDEVIEGQVLYKLHKVRERDKKIVQQKKEQAMDTYGFLQCEVCVFDFANRYGDIGKGFIECHHTTPLALFKAEKTTTLDDLALVCSNCHRMLHRGIDNISVAGLRTMLL